MNANILVVDDSALARRTMKRALEDAGHAVEEAADGNQALERYFLGRHDVVILDMVMHGMYGLQVLGEMQKINPDVSVIVATADVQDATAREVRDAGARAILIKPISRDRLLDTLRTVLDGGSQWN